jgi:hypothetical protein
MQVALEISRSENSCIARLTHITPNILGIVFPGASLNPSRFWLFTDRPIVPAAS